ncbi:Na(+)/glucose symporter [Anaerohalosphaera lusitana]|uniref:Na(+)/glucose symporter n=1 Tax=Anaerohalosphaera lusitana TaxID=1936003 RepID=A0A1U9NME7_9BACT|nr:sodium:solute symporter family protein [Anaerohalosphaera lusitana]AQT69083.1 Na(+)/glucose symporter [Anaerohalosphaera lusitana]
MSNFTLIDGGIVGVYILAVVTIGVMVKRYVSKVDQFLVAGRELNIYLGIASLTACEFGIVTCMYTAQNGYDKGFAGATPGILLALAMFIVGATGFGIKPLRKAGVMTIPELFEKKFGPKIRWMSGVVIVLGGLLNMGIFLRMGGDFLVAVCGLNPEYLEITMTLLLLGIGLYTIMGGMISVLITDYLQFIMMSIGLLIVTVLIFIKVGWGSMVEAIQMNYGEGGFNPFVHEQMGVMYVIFNALVALSVVLTWQVMIQRVLSTKDIATGGKIYKGTSPFFVCRFILPGLWGVAALAVLTPEQVGDNTMLAMPKFLGGFVPPIAMGITVAAMLAADMSTDASYMLTWGSVIYNDIMAPFHKGKWSQKKGLMWNRFIIAMIGVFLLVYGLWYKIEGDVWTYLGVTGSIYLSSMSVLLIACCYWKKANSWGAAAAIIVGSVMPFSFLVMQKVPATEELTVRVGPYIWGTATYVLVAIAMVTGSLLKFKVNPGRDELI